MSPLHAINSFLSWIQTLRMTALLVAAPPGPAPTPWSPRKKAIVATVSIIGITVALPLLAYYTQHAYSIFVALGVIYGIIVAYALMKLLRKKIQAGVAAFLGGLAFESIGSKEATLRIWIRSVAHWVTTQVSDVHHYFRHPLVPAESSSADWTSIDTAIVMCFWITVITIVLVVFTEAYFAWNQGTVEVTSTPSGAQVSADGVPKGNTPATLNLTTGGHPLRIDAPGYPAWSVYINIAAESEVTLSVNL
jgi:PEGA domain